MDSKINQKEPNGRASGCFIPLKESKFLLLGGSDREKAYNDIWELDTINKTWKLITHDPLNAMITPRSGCGYLITHNTDDNIEMYIHGGQNFFLQQFYGDMLKISINLNDYSKSQIENITKYPIDMIKAPIERNSHCLCYDNKKERMFIFGGGTRDCLLNDLWMFDIKTQQYTKCSFDNGNDIITPRELCGMVYNEEDNTLIVFGGRLYESIDDSMFIIRLGDNDDDNSAMTNLKCERASKMPISLCSFSYAKYTHYIIIYGGTDGNNFFNAFIVYNIKTKTFKKSKVIINKDLINFDPNLSVFLGRISSMMTIDAKAENLVLFGGSASDKEWNYVNVIKLNELLSEDNLVNIVNAKHK